jgi:hypothetical protein
METPSAHSAVIMIALPVLSAFAGGKMAARTPLLNLENRSIAGPDRAAAPQVKPVPDRARSETRILAF